jgi:hypothetical protein
MNFAVAANEIKRASRDVGALASLTDEAAVIKNRIYEEPTGIEIAGRPNLRGKW